MASTPFTNIKSIRPSLAALVLFALSCTPASLGPGELPYGAIPFAAPADYRAWWASTEACSGLTGNFDQISWYQVPGARTMQTDIGEKVGLWARRDGHTDITIAGEYTQHELVIRHEMLHELLGEEGHPASYFVERCGLTWESWVAAEAE